jgi:hypothetical protein
MEQYHVGQTLRITAQFVDELEDPADPTEVSFSLRIDSGDTETFVYGVDDELVKVEVGTYYVDVSLSVSGTYSYQFLGTGTVEAALEDSFKVITALDIHPLVELVEAKDYLQIPSTVADYDALITTLLMGIESTIQENLKSSIAIEERSVYLDGGCGVLLLQNTPVSPATESPVVEFTVYDAIYEEEVETDLYRLIPTTGQIYYNNEEQTWPEGLKRYLVTYTGGLPNRSDYSLILQRIKIAELTWLADLYYNRKASNTLEKTDDVTEQKYLERLPKRVETLLQGLLDISDL